MKNLSFCENSQKKNSGRGGVVGFVCVCGRGSGLLLC